MIRLANESDIGSIADMISRFSEEHFIQCSEEYVSSRKVCSLIHKSIEDKLCAVSEGADGLNGVVLGIILFNMWSDVAKEIREAALWVTPSHRGGMVGGRLLLKYNQLCEEAKKRDPYIKLSSICLMGDHRLTEGSLSRLGYVKDYTSYTKES